MIVFDHSATIQPFIQSPLEVSGTIGKVGFCFADSPGKEIKSTMNLDEDVQMETPQGTMKSAVKVAHEKELLK